MTKDEKNTQLRKLPGIDVICNDPRIATCIHHDGKDLVIYVARNVIDSARHQLLNGGVEVDTEKIYSEIVNTVELLSKPSLIPVVNATGIILHTNLGRAPLGPDVLSNMQDVVQGYSNLEYDLKAGHRGKRGAHLNGLLKFITGAEDAIVTNNNAAGIVLALQTLARGKEVIVSRGELIEIGGSFRIPEIMDASGAKMVEVGTTNKTRIADYETAINENTALLFKAHQSNFMMKGFTEEASIKELVGLSQRTGIPFVYDIGSGLLRKPTNLPLAGEPDVKSVISDGVDLVCFSTDKLLGGPQAGIVAGKKAMVQKLATSPLMRALRVGKLTISALQSVVRSYANDQSLMANVPLFGMMEADGKALERKATSLRDALSVSGIASETVESQGQCGGGTLPDLTIDSLAVKLVFTASSQKERSLAAERVFQELQHIEKPVLGVLRGGHILFDVLTIPDHEIRDVAQRIASVVN